MVCENSLSRFLLQTQFIMSKRNTKFQKLALLINSIDRLLSFTTLQSILCSLPARLEKQFPIFVRQDISKGLKEDVINDPKQYRTI